MEGIFTSIEHANFSWFKPRSNEPSYRFEMLGILVSLAVYNGFVLPFSFPQAFYLKLLDLPVDSIDRIRDGWPDLARGFQFLLDWDDPKARVEDVFLRNYVFTIDTGQDKIDVQIDKFPRTRDWSNESHISDDGGSRSSPLSLYLSARKTPRAGGRIYTDGHRSDDSSLPGPAMVTNENKGQYVDDYIYWLTHKSVEREFQAFSKGFFTCIDKPTIQVSESPVVIWGLPRGCEVS